MINKTISLYDKACTVELECLDGDVKDPKATRKYFDNEWKRCEIERSKSQKEDLENTNEELENTIWNQYYIFVISINTKHILNR